MLEQRKIWAKRFRKKHGRCGEEGYEAGTVHVLHHAYKTRAPRAVLTDEISIPKDASPLLGQVLPTAFYGHRAVIW